VAQRIVKTILPVDGVFRFTAVARAEGDGGLRVAVPAAIVRGLVHVGWTGRWLDVKLDGASFRVAVRPHPTSVMFGLPRKHRGAIRAGDQVALAITSASGPRAPRARRVRGELRKANATLSLPWLRS
jgi:hypothetical protein